MTAQMDTFKSENQSTTDLIGQNWQKLIDIIESRPDDSDAKSFDSGGVQRQYRTDDNVLRALQDVKRLRQKDMPLFGHCPETDSFYTVVCSSCSMILMPHALKDHYAKRHGDSDKSFATTIEKQSVDTQNKTKSKKLTPVKAEKGEKPKKVKSELTEEVLKDPKRSDKSKKMKLPDRTAPPELEVNPPRQEKVKPKNGSGSRYPELQPIVALSPMEVAESAGESNDAKDLPKKKQKEKKKNERKTDKVFDPDKHCGVINDSGKPCVRSILCKVHQVALKRAVPNRSMTYDMLIRILKTHSDEEKVKTDNGLFRPKTEPCEKSVEGLVPPSPMIKTWGQEQIIVKTEEPPIKRLKVKEEEMVEDEGDQSQFTLPSHLEALIDETLRTLKEVEENEPVVSMLPVPPKPEPILKWSLDSQPLQKEPSPPPEIVMDDVPWHSSHPKPLATNTFGCRLIGGLMSTCKKLDTLRKHLQSVWTSSSATTTTSCFSDPYSPSNKQNGCAPPVNVKNSFTYTKYIKKPSVQSKVAPLMKKTVPSPAMKGSSVKRKRKTSTSIISPVQNTSNASDIISGLLISNSVPIQRTAAAAVPAIPTGVIPVNSITGNSVPLRLFQGSLPVIASTAPNQPATFIQLNLCPK